MKPNPFSGLNHFTVPTGMSSTSFLRNSRRASATVPTAATSATTTAATTATVPAAAAAAARIAFTCFVDANRAAFDLRAIELLDRALRVSGRAHFDEPEPAALACRAI